MLMKIRIFESIVFKIFSRENFCIDIVLLNLNSFNTFALAVFD